MQLRGAVGAVLVRARTAGRAAATRSIVDRGEERERGHRHGEDGGRRAVVAAFEQVDEHRNERRREHAADEQLVDDVRRDVREVVRVGERAPCRSRPRARRRAAARSGARAAFRRRRPRSSGRGRRGSDSADRRRSRRSRRRRGRRTAARAPPRAAGSGASAGSGSPTSRRGRRARRRSTPTAQPPNTAERTVTRTGAPNASLPSADVTLIVIGNVPDARASTVNADRVAPGFQRHRSGRRRSGTAASRCRGARGPSRRAPASRLFSKLSGTSARREVSVMRFSSARDAGRERVHRGVDLGELGVRALGRDARRQRGQQRGLARDDDRVAAAPTTSRYAASSVGGRLVLVGARPASARARRARVGAARWCRAPARSRSSRTGRRGSPTAPAGACAARR